MATVVCVRLDDRTKAAIEKKATKAGQDRSTWLREAICKAAGTPVPSPDAPAPPPCSHPRPKRQPKGYITMCGECGQPIR